jgi:hypothetical protein
MENIDLGKSANQLWKESGSTLSFKTWLQREKDKGRFLPNKKLIEFNSADGTENSAKIQEIIKSNLEQKKPKEILKQNAFGLSKSIIAVSVILVLSGIGYAIYKKKYK